MDIGKISPFYRTSSHIGAAAQKPDERELRATRIFYLFLCRHYRLSNVNNCMVDLTQILFSVCLSVCLSPLWGKRGKEGESPPVWTSLCPSFCLSLFPSDCPSICPSLCPSPCPLSNVFFKSFLASFCGKGVKGPPICMSLFLSVHLSVHSSIRPSALCLSVLLSVRPSVCPSIRLSGVFPGSGT